MNDTSNAIPAALRDNPYPMFALARQMSPVLWNDAIRMWSVFRYDDGRAILRDTARFSNDPSKFMSVIDPERLSMLFQDPPRHTQLRNLVNQAFTPRRVAELEPRIRQITTELLDEVLPTGRMDLVGDLSYPLPVIIIAELLGIPAADRADFKRWSDVFVKLLGADFFARESEELTRVAEEFTVYFDEQIERHRREPSNDLIDALLAAEIDGRKLTATELLSFCLLLLVAGNETTTNLIGNAVRCFIDFPDELARLRADLSLVPSAVEEVLRFRSPVQAVARFAREDLELRGHQIKAGQRVAVVVGSANRDPEVFPDPERFDITRDPNPHLSFGLGVHFCLGAPLARLEAKVALEELLRRVPAFERAESGPYEPIEGFILHGITRLPLSFAPVVPATA